MANLTGPSGGAGVPALTITTEQQAVIALVVEIMFVMGLAIVADQGGAWAVAVVLVLIILWALFLMGNAGALRSKFGGVFGS